MGITVFTCTTSVCYSPYRAPTQTDTNSMTAVCGSTTWAEVYTGKVNFCEIVHSWFMVSLSQSLIHFNHDFIILPSPKVCLKVKVMKMMRNKKGTYICTFILIQTFKWFKVRPWTAGFQDSTGSVTVLSHHWQKLASVQNWLHAELVRGGRRNGSSRH